MRYLALFLFAIGDCITLASVVHMNDGTLLSTSQDMVVRVIEVGSDGYKVEHTTQPGSYFGAQDNATWPQAPTRWQKVRCQP